jgi:threonine-phosphate decarboxylase
MNITHGGNLFAIAREQGWDWRDVLDLSASMNPLGPPPGVRAAIEDALDRIVHYPERDPGLLAERLGNLWNVDPACILLGNGATDLLHFYARVDPQPATLVVPTFSEFHRAYPDARLVRWDDPQSWEGEDLLVMTRPNNPLGFVPSVPDTGRPLLIDESFLDFTNADSAIGKLLNLLVLRSLTKFYALPGLRIGALVGRVEKLRKLREPWQVNVLAEAAALAAIEDRDYAERSRTLISTEQSWIWEQLQLLPGIRPVPGCANYVLVYHDGVEALCRWFLERKILLRDQTGTPGIDGQCFRFAIRTRDENRRFLTLLKEYLCGQ